jgi:hypothetical protein
VDINHPDQYYTITKENGKKMPRFNSESNEYRVTFNELNVQRVPDILKTLQNLFDSVLTDVTKGMQEEDLVQVTLECPDLDFPIRLPFMQMNQLTSELLAEIERVLQSNEQFVLDHYVQLNITHVSLPKDGTRKRCDYVDTERFGKINVAPSRYKAKMTCVVQGAPQRPKLRSTDTNNGIIFKKIVVSKKSWRWNYTPRREYPYINAESKM